MEGKHRILVTGGAGYIGSVLVGQLLRREVLVSTLDVKPMPEEFEAELDNQRLRHITGDLRDAEIVAQSLAEVKDVIYLAGVSDGRAGKADPSGTASINIEGFTQFVEAARAARCRRLVFASTFGVYGYGYNESLNESLPPDPQEPYSASKWYAEQRLLAEQKDGLETVCLRLAMIFGDSPAMRLEFLLNRMVHDALTGGRILVMGGEQVRPQLHVRDASRYFIECLYQPAEHVSGQVFNACGFNKSVNTLAEEIRGIVGSHVTIDRQPPRPEEHTFVLNQDLLTKRTGLVPEVRLQQAIEEIDLRLHTVSS